MVNYDHNLLRGKMVEKGYSQKVIAKEIGISQTTLSKKMQGKADFTVTEMVTLMYLLGIEDPSGFFYKQ